MPEDLQHWQPAKTPDNRTLEGRYIRLEKLDPARHGLASLKQPQILYERACLALF